ncbi:MAG TPA: aspartyl protease family protein [Terriglobales bacterium]|nr:aspartyl protease family protein [Terriglobales bacterium]
MSLPAFLQSDGYRQIPLVRNGVGHFETGGTLAGRRVRVLIDTGAGSTVVSLSLAREMGLELASLGKLGGGAGGTQLEIFQLANATLLLDYAVPKPKILYAMDLSHVNAALAMKNATPVDVVLGVDVFERQAAVIDYGSSSLFLRDAE